MTVQISDPPDNNDFPYDEGWMATATIDSSDGVDGVLMDCITNEVYQSNGPSPSGTDANGNTIWSVPFTHDADIAGGDPLLIYCYDTEVDGDGDTHSDTASQQGLKPGHRPGPGQPKKLPGGSPSIQITGTKVDGTTISVAVNLTPGSSGRVILALMNRQGGGRPTVTSALGQYLPPSKYAPRVCTFLGVQTNNWTHIWAIAVIDGQKTRSKAKPIKAPHKKDGEGEEEGRK